MNFSVLSKKKKMINGSDVKVKDELPPPPYEEPSSISLDGITPKIFIAACITNNLDIVKEPTVVEQEKKIAELLKQIASIQKDNDRLTAEIKKKEYKVQELEEATRKRKAILSNTIDPRWSFL